MVEWLLEVGDGTDDAVEDHLARCDAVAGPDGSVFWVGFVYVGQDGGELGSVVGDFENVVLGLAGEVGYVAGSVGYVAGLAEPGWGPGEVRVLRRASARGGRQGDCCLNCDSCDYRIPLILGVARIPVSGRGGRFW